MGIAHECDFWIDGEPLTTIHSNTHRVAATSAIWEIARRRGLEITRQVLKTIADAWNFEYASATKGPVLYALSDLYGNQSETIQHDRLLRTLRHMHPDQLIGSAHAIMGTRPGSWTITRACEQIIIDKYNSGLRSPESQLVSPQQQKKDKGKQ